MSFRGILNVVFHENIGKYERNENLPSIEMVARMAKAFGVTVDFLIAEGENASYKKQTVERINDIQRMDADTKNILFNVIDMQASTENLNLWMAGLEIESANVYGATGRSPNVNGKTS